MGYRLFSIACLLWSCLTCGNTQITNESIHRIRDNSAKWNKFIREMSMDELLIKLSREHKPEPLLIQDVNLISMASDSIHFEVDVVISNGKIAGIGKDLSATLKNEQVKIIDGKGKFLLPGLTDAHVHIANSNAEKLLNLVTGVTTVRDMAASPWMVPYRNEINANHILAPTTYLAGTMLNENDLWFFSDIVKTTEEAREKVRKQKQEGYDFIKVWNVLSEDLLRAVSEECQVQNMDLVGHIPHGVTVETALSLKMRTLEHYKGFLLDRTLKISDEDFVKAVNQSQNAFWLCPTFALYLDGLRGDPAIKFLNSSPAIQYVPLEVKNEWRQAAQNNEFQSDFGNVPDTVFRLSKEIFERLEGSRVKYIAGTDNNGSNLYMVPGFALHEELKIFSQLGMSRYESL
jgi:hypothetical protein